MRLGRVGTRVCGSGDHRLGLVVAGLERVQTGDRAQEPRRTLARLVAPEEHRFGLVDPPARNQERCERFRAQHRIDGASAPDRGLVRIDDLVVPVSPTGEELRERDPGKKARVRLGRATKRGFGAVRMSLLLVRIREQAQRFAVSGLELHAPREGSGRVVEQTLGSQCPSQREPTGDVVGSRRRGFACDHDGFLADRRLGRERERLRVVYLRDVVRRVETHGLLELPEGLLFESERPEGLGETEMRVAHVGIDPQRRAELDHGLTVQPLVRVGPCPFHVSGELFLGRAAGQCERAADGEPRGAAQSSNARRRGEGRHARAS